MRYSLGFFSNYSKLRVFCCLAYAYVKKDKLGSKKRKYIILGYVYRVKGYAL
jgi:hypothetical protein